VIIVSNAFAVATRLKPASSYSLRKNYSRVY